jgi:8-oxo-dGTP pyrophosphatase MutT (NUDIX family)
MAVQLPKARFSICVLEDSKSRLLLLKRALDDPIGGGLWGFLAGHIEASESAHECALREMDEEIGNAHELLEISRLGPIRDTFYGGKYEIHLFHFRWIDGEVELNHEHTSYAWVDKTEFIRYEAMLGTEQDIVLLDIWPKEIFTSDRLGVLPQPAR